MEHSKQDKHYFDPFIKYFGNLATVIVFAISMALIGICMSSCKSDWTWFARFGSLITIAGLLLISSPIFDKGIYISSSSTGGGSALDKDGNEIQSSQKSRETGNKIFIGIIITIVGTVIWGFGDLLG